VIVAYLWEELSPAQQADAVRGRLDIGVDGKPPSGAAGIWWVYDGKEWSWKHAISPDDRRRGIRLLDPKTLAGQDPADDLDVEAARSLTAALKDKPRPHASQLVATHNSAGRPMPGELWRQAGENEQRYVDLLREHPRIETPAPVSPGPARAAKARKARR
jgi:hypothetical protein